MDLDDGNNHDDDNHTKWNNDDNDNEDADADNIIAVIRMIIMAFVNLPVSNVTLTSFTFSPCNIPGTSLLCGEELFPAPRIASRRNKIGSLGESSSGVKLNFTLASILSSSPLLSRKGCRGM